MRRPMQISELVQRIESILESYYGFDAVAHASDCLMAHENSAHVETHTGRLLVLSEDDQVFVGIEFSPSVVDDATSAFDPGRRVSASNIAAMLIVIEEVSHFHLLTQRVVHGLSVTQLELEWQAEVDKLVVLPALISGTGTRIAPLGLRRALIGSFKLRDGLSQQESFRYMEATRYFSQLLRSATMANPDMTDPAIKSRLRDLYRMSWNAKSTAIAA